MSVKSFKHKNDKRTFIPSIEEEGYEKENPKVKEKTTAIFDKDPIINCGQDPHLVWRNKYGQEDSEQELKVDIRSLYRSEHISPEILIKKLFNYKEANSHPLLPMIAIVSPSEISRFTPLRTFNSPKDL